MDLDGRKLPLDDEVKELAVGAELGNEVAVGASLSSALRSVKKEEEGSVQV